MEQFDQTTQTLDEDIYLSDEDMEPRTETTGSGASILSTNIPPPPMLYLPTGKRATRNEEHSQLERRQSWEMGPSLLHDTQSGIYQRPHMTYPLSLPPPTTFSHQLPMMLPPPPPPMFQARNFMVLPEPNQHRIMIPSGATESIQRRSLINQDALKSSTQIWLQKEADTKKDRSEKRKRKREERKKGKKDEVTQKKEVALKKALAQKEALKNMTEEVEKVKKKYEENIASKKKRKNSKKKIK